MYRIYSALIEIVAAAVFIIPIWCIYNKLFFRSWKIVCPPWLLSASFMERIQECEKIIYSRICNDIIYRNSSNFHWTNDRYR